jgi:GNAT superfamily N-acetyltransferase
MSFAIRTLTFDDLKVANRICRTAYASLNEHRTELSHYLRIQPDGWFLVTKDGEPVGLGGTVNYGTFAYIGLVAVDPSYQRQGIGQNLMEYLLTWLSERECHCVLLDSSEVGAPLYTRLGFQEAGATHVFRLESLPVSIAPLSAVTPLTADDFPELVDFDTRYFGISRMTVLSTYFAAYPERFLVIRGEQGQITGYLLAQSQCIGPWIAQTPEEALALLQAALCLPFNTAPWIIIPEENTAALAVVQKMGFQCTLSFRHMRRGDMPITLRRDQIYGLASAAIG